MKNRVAPRVAVLCRHDLSLLEPGDKLHTHDKIMALSEQVPVILFAPLGYASREMHSRMRVVEVSPPGLRFALALIFSLLRHRRDYDCIYSRDPLLLAFATPMTILGKSLIVEMNGIPSLETKVRRRTHRVRVSALTSLICGVMWLLEAVVIRCADLVLPVTEKMKSTILSEYQADPRKVVVIPNAVDTTKFRPLEKEGGEIRRGMGMGEEMVVLYLGTFSARWRGSEQLFLVARAVQRKRDDIVFLVVGSGPLLGEMKAATLGTEAMNRIVFVGAVDHCLVPAYMSVADVYVYDVTQVRNVLVEKQGLCPTKILEAMACGKPVIAPKEPELEDILCRSNGGFSASSMQEVQALIERFADSPELARSMGASARRYVELNHDLTRLTRRTVELISEVVSSRRS